MQIVETAIDRSKSHNEIVHIDALDAKQASVSLESVHRELLAECDGDADGNAEREYWGRDVDGNEWRVHAETP